MISYSSFAELVCTAEKENKKISDLVLADQAEQLETTTTEVYNKMCKHYDIMCASIEEGCKEGIKSTSGLSGGDAFKMKQALNNGTTSFGNLFSTAIMYALAVSELNAAMGRIVACPTAGSCGILPAAVISVARKKGLSKKKAVMSLFTASGLGMVIAKNACLSGAQGGCQAECGSASAMAAAAVVELLGGSPTQIANAAAIAIKNQLGLVCDPVAGLVEIPCIKRNAGGVTNAFCAAELALSGIESAIPLDEVILAMKNVGDLMSQSLKETAEAGLASTKTAKALYKKVFENN